MYESVSSILDAYWTYMYCNGVKSPDIDVEIQKVLAHLLFGD